MKKRQIAVIAEHRNGVLTSGTLETLSFSRELERLVVRRRKRVRLHCAKYDIFMRDLAPKMSVSLSTLYRWLRGEIVDCYTESKIRHFFKERSK